MFKIKISPRAQSQLKALKVKYKLSLALIINDFKEDPFIANPENRKRKLADEWINNHNKSAGFGMKLEDTTSVSSWSFIGKSLARDLIGKYSYRVGVYRIVYRINVKENMVEIISAGHRSVVYN